MKEIEVVKDLTTNFKFEFESFESKLNLFNVVQEKRHKLINEKILKFDEGMASLSSQK